MYGLIYVTVFHFMLGVKNNSYFIELMRNLEINPFLQEPCHIDPTAFVAQWVMVTSYTYLFVDFYLNKYKGVKEARDAEKKEYAVKEEKTKKIE